MRVSGFLLFYQLFDQHANHRSALLTYTKNGNIIGICQKRAEGKIVMPRPRKCRKVCRMPIADVFTANSKTDEHIILTVDEYECIRLIDHQGFSQEQCAEYMQVSRATAQLIYETARKKLAEALVKGCSIRIEGGEYRICDGSEEYCGCGGCQEHRRGWCAE